MNEISKLFACCLCCVCCCCILEICNCVCCAKQVFIKESERTRGNIMNIFSLYSLFLSFSNIPVFLYPHTLLLVEIEQVEN